MHLQKRHKSIKMSKHSILFVDDELCILDALRRALRSKREHWDMHFVVSVAEALAEIQKANFDAVVTDITMPGQNGLDLLAQLQESNATKEIPVIILTGLDETDLKRRALEMGAFDLLNKPVVAEDLIARLQSVLLLKAHQDELKEYQKTLEQAVRDRTLELEQSRLEIVWRLAKAGEYRDELTGNHVVRVGNYSRTLADQIGMPNEFVDMIFLASPLHDIGKIGVPDRILHKNGPLTPDERWQMQKHCAMGSEILQERVASLPIKRGINGGDLDELHRVGQNPLLEHAAVIAMTHHEKWDGSGYPNNLRGEEIPIEARIVAIADVYDALSHARPYKPAFSEEKVLAIMKEEAIRHFDPEVFAAFLCIQNEFREIRVQLSDSKRAAA